MGHYDSYYDFDREEELKRVRGKVKGEITRELNNITNVNKLRQIRMFIKNIDKINDFLEIASKLNALKP